MDPLSIVMSHSQNLLKHDSADEIKQPAAQLLTPADPGARIRELPQAISEGTIAPDIRIRAARAQVLQNRLEKMLALSAATALEYSYNAQGATGLVVRECRGKDCEETWKFDSALETAIRETLKQVAIEQGQWTEKRDTGSGAAELADLKARINRGRDRVAAAKKEALARAEKWGST